VSIGGRVVAGSSVGAGVGVKAVVGLGAGVRDGAEVALGAGVRVDAEIGLTPTVGIAVTGLVKAITLAGAKVGLEVAVMSGL